MIGIPSEFAPSSLLHYEQVSSVVQTLLQSSRTHRLRGEWGQARRCALDAQAICREANDHVGLALAQLHMVDFCCEVGEIGQAMERCQEAHQTLHLQPDRTQQHNEAAAAYALGLLHELQLLSNNLQALIWYQEALRQFRAAQVHWATVNGRSQYETCQRACQWIEDLSTRIIESRVSKHSWRPAFDIWRSDSAETPFTRNRVSARGYIMSDQVMIDGITYRLHPVQDQSGNAPTISKANYHFALPVPEDQWAVPETQVGDYVFIRQQWSVDKERVGVVWEPGNGWVAVGFKRGRDGKIMFYHRHSEIIGDAEPTPGDPADKLKGYIIGLLKPEE